LRKRHLDGEFSLTEARLLYEIGAHPDLTASSLRNTLELDAGYISRSLSSLSRRKLIRQSTSKADRREKLLTLTTTGQKAVARLNDQSAKQMAEILAGVSTLDRKEIVESFSKVRSLLSRSIKPEVRVIRLHEETPDTRDILQEYYAAVHVVQRDKPGAIRKIIDAPTSGVWLAYLGEEVVGCVVLRRLAAIPHASECKRLYVKPSARGRGIAGKLLDALEEYARNQGVEWIYLDSYDDLKAAIALYGKRGYDRCDRYNDNPQATLFMRKQIAERQSLRRT
jgi:DNA-binding MarR family transcriptional regulator/N-acetylglutamate synthase-like GNAT family acetyltransferase